MAITNLHETLISYTLEKSRLALEISELNDQKTNAVASQADMSTELSLGKTSIRTKYKKMYEENPELREKYLDYTQIPEFEEELEKLQADYKERVDELAAWETNIDNQIAIDNTKLKEIEAYEASYKSMLQSNISNDFNYGLNS